MEKDWLQKEKLHFAAQDGNLEEVKKLLKEEFPVNAFDEDLGWTPLHYAAKEGHLEVMACLIEQGADVNAHQEEKIGETPLGLAAGDCSYEVAKLLVDSGADPTIPGWMQLTALRRAEKRKKPEGIKVYELLKKAAEKFK